MSKIGTVVETTGTLLEGEGPDLAADAYACCVEAEIIADTQRREVEERASDGQAATKKGRWKSPQ